MSAIQIINEIKTIHESHKIIISQGTLANETRSVVFKKLRSDYPDPKDIANIQHEYSLLKVLEQAPGVIRTHRLIHHEHNLILVLEHFDSISLKEYLKQEILTLENFFTIAINIIDSLAEIHARHIIHKDINPGNILINPKTLEIKIIDFSIASQLTEEIKDAAHPDILEGTLAYIAPEQTGRMNRPVDYRSDYYSLGITLYELLAKKTPFQSDDPLEIVYDHIAKLPPPIDDIPKQLNLLIAKLLAKNADERYLSANGIKTDLLQCAKQWINEEKIDAFALGQRDGADILTISHKLYGREKQIEQLLTAYNRVSQGAIELMLVTGYSGVGKTSLVREVHKPMTRENGIFLSGKFDQLQKNIPYHAVAQAFGRFVHQTLAESDEVLQKTRGEILQALGRRGQVIIQVIPDLELLIGKQPAVPVLGPVESQNRLLIVFQDFIHVFAKADHPLILFLDDLQWADSASLKLMELVLSDPTMQYLFLIGAYRDNEVEVGHPLLAILNNLKKVGIESENISLIPLSERDTSRLLINSLHNTASYLQPLTALVYSKTGGNPFFLNQFLKTIYQEHLLSYNFELKAWQWDADEINRMKNTDNVVDLLAHNIQKLSQPALHLLTLASCIGNNFNFQTLATISEKTPQQIYSSLKEILQSGLILPADDKYKRVIENQNEFPELLEEKIDYNFLHDRVYQAAYKLIPDETKQPTHLQIGRLLLKEKKGAYKASELFDIMNHFVQSLSLITDEEEKRQLAALFLHVGKAAMASTAYKAAYSYLSTGISLIESEKNWETDYELLFPLYLHLSECSYLADERDRSDHFYKLLIKHAKTANEKLEVYAIMISMYSNEGNVAECYNIVTSGLKLFGIHLPANPSNLQILLEYLKTEWSLRKKIKKLEHQEIVEVDQMTLDRFWVMVAPSIYYFNMKTFAYATLIFARRMLNERSLTDDAPAILFGLAILKWAAFKDRKGSLTLMELANKMSQKCKPFEAHKLYFYYALFTVPYREPIAARNYLQNEAYQVCLENGDFPIAAASLSAAYPIPFYTKSLHEFYQDLNEVEKIQKRISQVSDYGGNNQVYEMLHSFLTEEKMTVNFQTAIEQIRKSLGDNKPPNAGFYSLIFVLYFLNNDIPNALNAGNFWFQDYRQYVDGSFWHTNHLQFYFLILADAYATASRKEQKIYLKRMKEIEARFKEYNDIFPANYAHLYFLCKAEFAKLRGHFLESISYYDKAIDHAKAQQFMIYMALINERAGQYYLKSSQRSGRFYIHEAHYYYILWGATAKAKQLESQFPEMFKPGDHENSLSVASTTSTSTSTANLDLLSIIKSNQVISKEIGLTGLLRKLVSLLIEYTGAQKAVILFKEKDQLHVVAQAEGQNEEDIQTENVLLDKITNLPKTLIDYVQHSNEHVILNEPNQFEQFNQDPYIAKTNPKSVLCVPIMQTNRVVCYIYLENTLSTHMFTPERLRVFDLLAGQVGISIENARLYDSTSRFVPKKVMQLLNKKSVLEISAGECVEKKMTAMFTDIRNYTTISEQMSANETFAFVNEYITYMAPVIRKHNGFIVQYLGDAILSLFPNHSDDALNAALDMAIALREFNQEQKNHKQNKPIIKVGYGINTGITMLGLLGEREQIDTSVISDVINLASRIEGLNKIYNTTTLMSDLTFESLDNSSQFHFRMIDKVRVKGRTHPTSLYEVFPTLLANEESAREQQLQAFKQAFTQYEQNQFDQAANLFAAYVKAYADDQAAKILQKRCEKFAKEGAPPDWDGAFTLLRK